MCDTPDKKIISSGGWNERDTYKILSESFYFLFFLFQILILIFLLLKNGFITLLKLLWQSWNTVDFGRAVTCDWRIE